jgi:flagellar biosynthesis/type III secretory pathway protein FliH
MAQTSVEWYAEQLEIYEEKALIRKITIMQLNIKKQELLEQANKMNNQELSNAYQEGWKDAITEAMKIISKY